MKILVLADEESKFLWDFFEPSKLDQIDLIISCGDLKPAYLSFLATYTHAPVLYIHGNHDGCYRQTPPEGCICIDNDLVVYHGIRILGLGGSLLYNYGSFQYTQKEMFQRVRKLRGKIKKHNGFDLLITHAPAYRINDTDDLPHTGFSAFVDLMDNYAPSYMIHGHIHLNYNWRNQRISSYKDTTIINAYERHIFEYQGPFCDLPDSLYSKKKHLLEWLFPG